MALVLTCMHSMLYIKYYLLCHKFSLYSVEFFYVSVLQAIAEAEVPMIPQKILYGKVLKHFSSIPTACHRPVDFCKF